MHANIRQSHHSWHSNRTVDKVLGLDCHTYHELWSNWYALMKVILFINSFICLLGTRYFLTSALLVCS